MGSKVKSSEKGDTKEVENVKSAEIKESKEPMDLASILLDLQKQINDLKKSETANIDTSNIDTIEDYLEVPAVFFSFSFEYAIHADVRHGKETIPPLGQFIKFKKLYRYSRKGAARAVETISVSQATVRSKATAEWLRKHTLFGIKFFENINDVKSVDVTLAEKMAESSARVSAMSDYQVIERCQAENITVHGDPETLRKELIQRLAENDIKRTKSKQNGEFIAERDENNRKVVQSILSDNPQSSKKDVY